jgi:hypothetical protein
MPEWESLTEDEKATIIEAVYLFAAHDEEMASGVYEAIRKVMKARADA